MKAFLLAAGLGSRLRPLTDAIPKVMVPIAPDLPLLEHTLLLLKSQGIHEFVINLHYKPERIVRHFGGGARFGVRIRYTDESGGLLETAGGIRKAAPLLSDDFLLVYGDQVHFYDFGPLIRLHERERPLATLALKHSDHPQNGDLAEIDSRGRIVAWHPRPHSFQDFSGGRYLNTGLAVLSKEILAHIPDRPASLDREIIPPLVQQGLPFFGIPTEEKILDIGTPDKYEIARSWFAERVAARPQRCRALFLDRDGVILRSLPRGQYVTEWGQTRLLPGIRELVAAAHEKGWRVFVITNQPQISYGFLSEPELKIIHENMQAALGNSLDAIYYCPHQDTDLCACRKPRIGLIARATMEWNVDPASSLMIGDSDRDVAAGKAAGCRTVFLRNEFNASERDRCQPDETVDRLADIVL
jgi:mannose-1-phosphate guanylyltransferase / phosphomannomutase